MKFIPRFSTAVACTVHFAQITHHVVWMFDPSSIISHLLDVHGYRNGRQDVNTLVDVGYKSL